MIKFSDWRFDSGFLFVTAYGISTESLFVELASLPNDVSTSIAEPLAVYLTKNVTTVCIRGGGKYTGSEAKELLKEYLIVNKPTVKPGLDIKDKLGYDRATDTYPID